MQIFVTGTGTGIGKTIFCSWLLYYLYNIYNKDYYYWKPIQSGIEYENDSNFVSEFCQNVYQPLYSFPQSLSPHLAAQLSNQTISLDILLNNRPKNSDLIIEGAGGIFVPLNKNSMMIDFIQKLEIPVLIVASSELGTINHTCLTIEALNNRGIKTLGVIMNGQKNNENKLAIERYGKTVVLQEIDYFGDHMNDIEFLKNKFRNEQITQKLFNILFQC
jgi:dethiobiotin synthetase